MWQEIDRVLLDSAVLVLAKQTGLATYDFTFTSYFPCQHLQCQMFGGEVIARIGAFDDIEVFYGEAFAQGIKLCHDPAQHYRCSRLSNWYGLIPEYTPQSIWFKKPPDAAEIEKTLGWPVFMKGDRQTSRHKRRLSILENREAYLYAIHEWQNDPILKWQEMVFRKFVPLRPVEDINPEVIPSSYEFRTFWWKKQLVGCGPYWTKSKKYELDRSERPFMLALAEKAAQRLNVKFLTVDLAQTVDGKWIIVECNDGQESGYAGVSPIGLWENLLQIEKHQA